MSENPIQAATDRQERFRSRIDKQEFYEGLLADISKDLDDRSEWSQRQETLYRRRYCREFRNVDWPWVGAADIVPPTIDMTIDRVKATLTRLALPKQVVAFETTLPQLQEQARTDEIYFNWLLLKRIPDFRRQIILGIDSMLQYGFCVWKVYWDYRTRNVYRKIDLRRVPQRYAQLAEVYRQSAQQAAAVSGQPLTPKDIADATFQALAEKIAEDYGADLSNGSGGEAVESILAGLKSEGKTRWVDIKVREVESNYPRVLAVPPDDFVAPTGTVDIQDAERIVHILRFSEPVLKQRARDLGWNRAAVNRLIEQRTEKGPSSQGVHWSGRQTLDWVRDSREGVSTVRESLYEIYEVHLLHDIDGDGVPERCWTVVTPDLPPGEGVLQPIKPEPYEHGKWPFVVAKAELNEKDRLYSSRGIPEKIDDIDLEVMLMHRARLNYLDLMAPTFQYRLGSQLAPELLQFVPGSVIPVTTLGDFAPVQVPDRTMPTEREENILLGWNERYIGSVDALADQQNISEARTATEVAALQSAKQTILGHRGIVLQSYLKELFDQMWDLVNQLGDQDEYQRVTGRPMRRKSSIEIQRDYAIVPVGTLETSDPAREAQRAYVRLQALFQIWSATGGTGVLANTHQINIGEALVRWLERENVLDARSVVRTLSDEERQALAEEAAQRKAMQQAVEDNIPVTEEGLRAGIQELAKRAPHGKAQRILR